jgi:hypothetical protein
MEKKRNSPGPKRCATRSFGPVFVFVVIVVVVVVVVAVDKLAEVDIVVVDDNELAQLGAVTASEH